MIRIWQIGNTGVRNPMRIQDALRVYSASSLVGKVRGVTGSIAFMQLLHSQGVLNNQQGCDNTGSYGRKWRLVFNKNGFTYNVVPKNETFSQSEIGEVDTLTPFGKTFLEATTIPAIQECFLRSMSMMMEPLESGETFSPLRWTLAVMLAVEERTGDNSISFIEFATQVQTTTPQMNMDEVVDSLLKIRNERNSSSSKREFDKKLFKKLKENYDRNVGNFSEYGDMNLRYLKATGIVKSKGKGIVIVSEKHELAKHLAENLTTSQSLFLRLNNLYSGPCLPTDEESIARMVLSELEQRLKEKGIPYTVDHSSLKSTADINNVRHKIEELLSQNEEEIYAKDQKNRWEEIADYMELIISRKTKKVYNDDTEINIPKEETSAYLEWCLWRAFLAMNTLKNKPYRVRRFKIDQDFLPIGTAPGNGPDLIAEYGNCAVAIEVTLSDSSRQEAMEGEPVRRHVSDVCLQLGKPTYGLFIAKHIDTNTAETFRSGTWYTKEDAKTRLDIVPLTLKQFREYFVSIFASGKHSNGEIVEVLKACVAERDTCDAPSWKKKIAKNLAGIISNKGTTAA